MTAIHLPFVRPGEIGMAWHGLATAELDVSGPVVGKVDLVEYLDADAEHTALTYAGSPLQMQFLKADGEAFAVGTEIGASRTPSGRLLVDWKLCDD